ncbi:MAG: DUF3772 domain-containing protein [Proteobacteria bacterium]|nr:DUF3772 domain-containing protein [Pseudomonadota bacterium]
MTRFLAFFSLSRFLAFALLVAFSGMALAQNVPVREPRALIDSGRLELTQIEAALRRETLKDDRLAELRAQLDAIAAGIDEMVGREQPRADEIKARIEKLGPAPDTSKGQSESPDVARDRAEQQKHWQEADETLRLARALGLRVEQVKEAVLERRRQNFTRAILAQEDSVLSPWLWYDVARQVPADFRALNFLLWQWGETILGNLDWYELVFLVALAIGAGAFLPRARRWVRSGSFGLHETEEGVVEANALEKALIALRAILFNAAAPALLLYLLHMLFRAFGLLPGRADPVMEAFTSGLAFVLGMSALGMGVLSPHRRETRLFDMPDRMARELWRVIRLVALIVALGRIAEALAAAIVASLPLTILMRGLFASLAALAIMRGFARAFQSEGEESGGSGKLLPLRLGGWSAAIAILGAAVAGFVALAGFLVAQVVWIAILGLSMALALVFIEEVLGAGLSAKGVLGKRVREATGLAASSLDQISVLGAGAARLILFVMLAMLALAPWGVDSSNLLGNVRAAFFGFQVGGVSISLATIALAIALFAVGFLLTRAIQNWLDTRYLPQTDLDVGLRNSIRTIFGYVGTFVAAMIALGQLGLSLEKITIVAGALSVGIGFGLQSIVSNFVSGLILLWERPIRVGDWIVVDNEQGTVKRINVRATEIQTFDRASLIIPNSAFISGRVKNWMHADRTGRIIIPVSVEYQAEPDEVAQLLKDAALAHREVMSEPAPTVVFKNFGESGLDFELRCFVDVDSMSVTRSELLFDIFRRLREAKIAIPYPTRRVEIAGIAGNEEAAEALVQAMAKKAE